jgi:hypothetical protein
MSSQTVRNTCCRQRWLRSLKFALIVCLQYSEHIRAVADASFMPVARESCACRSVRLMGVRVTQFKNQYGPQVHLSTSSRQQINAFFSTTSHDLLHGDDDPTEQETTCEQTESNIADARTHSSPSSPPQSAQEPPSCLRSPMVCPVCELYRSENLEAMTTHVDRCLRGGGETGRDSEHINGRKRTSQNAVSAHSKRARVHGTLTRWLQSSSSTPTGSG